MNVIFRDQPLREVLRRPALSEKDASFAVNLIEEIITTNYLNRDNLKTEIEVTLKEATDSLFSSRRYSYDQARAILVVICPRLIVDIDFFLYQLKKTNNKKEFVNYLSQKIPGFNSFQVSDEVIDTLLVNFLENSP